MTMLTRCPQCDTVFRVTAQQLQKQHGQVRCGRCAQIFDGFQTLSSDSDRTVGQQSAESTGAAEPAPPPTAEPAATLARESLQGSAAAAMVEPSPAPAAGEAAAEPETEEVAAVPERRRAVYAWAAASALLVLALLAQAAYVYRVELAARYPATKPVLLAACATLGCEVPLPQEPRSITIEASDLQIPDATQPGVIQLTATFRSHAPYDVAYPALDLVLTNAQEHTLARRIFLPHEYLGRQRDLRAGIPPNAEVTVQLELDTGDLGASGFRLDLLAAPS